MTVAVRAARAITMCGGPGVIDDALLISKNGRIVDIGSYKSLSKTYSGPIKDLGRVTITPGLINCHTHLELSGLYGQTTKGQGFEAWVKSLIPLLHKKPDRKALRTAVAEISGCGTAFVGDVTSRNPALVVEHLESAGLGYTLFVEFFGYPKEKTHKLVWPKTAKGFLEAEGKELFAAAGHALYSTSPDLLRAAWSWCAKKNRTFSLHLAEHRGEVDLLATGKGAFAELLAERVLPRDFKPPGMSPVAYADALNLLDGRTLAVHCVWLNDNDIEVLRTRRVNVCLCPRSNAFIGVGRAPWEKLVRAGINLCLGTDSLGSNTDLNLWNEAEYVLRGFKGNLAPEDVLAWMTINPARALGAERNLGTLAPGKQARYAVMPEAMASLLPRA